MVLSAKTLSSAGRNDCNVGGSDLCKVKLDVVPCCSCGQWSQEEVYSSNSLLSAVQVGMTAMLVAVTCVW